MTSEVSVIPVKSAHNNSVFTYTPLSVDANNTPFAELLVALYKLFTAPWYGAAQESSVALGVEASVITAKPSECPAIY